MLGKQCSRVCGLSFEVEIVIPGHSDFMFMRKRTKSHSGSRHLSRFSRIGEVPSDDQHVAVRDSGSLMQAVRVGNHNGFHNGYSNDLLTQRLYRFAAIRATVLAAVSTVVSGLNSACFKS